MRMFLAIAAFLAVLLSCGCYFIEVKSPRRPRGPVTQDYGYGGRNDFCPDEYQPSWDDPIVCEVQEDSYGPIGECCSWRDAYSDRHGGDVCLETWCLWDDYCGWEFIDSWCIH